jgi:hypothetical protein
MKSMIKKNLIRIVISLIAIVLFNGCEKALEKKYPSCVVDNNAIKQYETAILTMYELGSKNECSLIKEDHKSVSLDFTSLDLELDTLIINGDTATYKMTFYEYQKDKKYKAFYLSNPMECIYPCGVVFIKNKLYSFYGCDASYGFLGGINDSLELDKNFRQLLTSKTKLSNTLNSILTQ